jgi:phage-related minor tail protein
MIIGLLAGLLLLIDDYMTYMEGGRSYFDWGPWEKTIESIRKQLPDLIDLIINVGSAIAVIWGASKAFTLAEGAVKLFQKALVGIPKVIGLISRAFKLLTAAVVSNPIGAALFLIISLAMLIYYYWDDIVAWFKEKWAQIKEAFPNFAALAEGMYNAIVNWIGKAVDWVKEKFFGLLDGIPDVVKKFGAVLDKFLGYHGQYAQE